MGVCAREENVKKLDRLENTSNNHNTNIVLTKIKNIMNLLSTSRKGFFKAILGKITQYGKIDYNDLIINGNMLVSKEEFEKITDRQKKEDIIKLYYTLLSCMVSNFETLFTGKPSKLLTHCNGLKDIFLPYENTLINSINKEKKLAGTRNSISKKLINQIRNIPGNIRGNNRAIFIGNNQREIAGNFTGNNRAIVIGNTPKIVSGNNARRFFPVLLKKTFPKKDLNHPVIGSVQNILRRKAAANVPNNTNNDNLLSNNPNAKNNSFKEIFNSKETNIYWKYKEYNVGQYINCVILYDRSIKRTSYRLEFKNKTGTTFITVYKPENIFLFEKVNNNGPPNGEPPNNNPPPNNNGPPNGEPPNNNKGPLSNFYRSRLKTVKPVKPVNSVKPIYDILQKKIKERRKAINPDNN